jgi:hypothetical protein
MYTLCSYYGLRPYNNGFIVSTTSLTSQAYGEIPRQFVAERGLAPEGWDELKSLQLLRSVVMTMVLKDDDLREKYWQEIVADWTRKLQRIVEQDLFLTAGS